MAGRKHIHKYYYGLLVAKEQVWACAFAGCTHYMPKHMEGAVEGRFSKCWKCGETFVLDSQNMKLDKPICDDCQLLGGEIREEQQKRFIEDPLGTQARETGKKLKSEGKEICPVCGIREKMETGNWCIECVISSSN